MSSNGESPLRIVAYCCHYCAYAAADLAGSMRLQYPTNIRMIKLPCTGKLEVIHLLKRRSRRRVLEVWEPIGFRSACRKHLFAMDSGRGIGRARSCAWRLRRTVAPSPRTY